MVEDRDQRPASEPQDRAEQRLIVLGRICGLYGVRGWLRLRSETEPPGNILNYRPWRLRYEHQWRCWNVEAGRPQGKGLVVKLQGCDDRAAAAKLLGTEIAVPRSQLADDLAPGEYYWADLEGLRVMTLNGVELGRLDHLFATGANDVMVVRGERERLLPYLPEQVVKEVDLRHGVMRVEWDPEF